MSFFSLVFRYKDKKSPDKLGLYPEKFHVPSFPERRYLWTSRVLVICAVFSICINIALTSIIYLLPDQKTTLPRFLNINENTYTLDETEPADKTVSYIDLLSEKYITDYIQMRHSIPISTADLYYRWDKTSKFYWYSGNATYYQFINKINDKQIMNFIRQHAKRIVDIDYVKKISDNFWMAQFKTSTYTKNMKDPDVIIWRAYLQIRYYAIQNYDNIEKDETDKMNYTQNPFGFKVMAYNVNYAGRPEKSYSAMQASKKVFESLEDIMK